MTNEEKIQNIKNIILSGVSETIAVQQICDILDFGLQYKMAQQYKEVNIQIQALTEYLFNGNYVDAATTADTLATCMHALANTQTQLINGAAAATEPVDTTEEIPEAPTEANSSESIDRKTYAPPFPEDYSTEEYAENTDDQYTVSNETIDGNILFGQR